MKRYVLEFARDVMRANDPEIKTGEKRHPLADDIIRALQYCGRGSITNIEAVRAISDIDQRARDMSWLVEEQKRRAES